ncbi:MFS transporter [Paenirhodobacter sp.]|uniref:MFS transporter n=1 Tax=Paenirhodobacter sp. TaxID=1965326 RepID=UPI003B403A0D
MIQSAATMGVALVVMGASMATLDINVNVRVSERESETALPLMNYNHALYSFGFAAAALAVGAAQRAGFGPEQIQPAMALLLVLAAAMMIERQVPLLPADTAGGRTPWPVVWPAAAILFAAFVTENATESWSALHIERTFATRPGEGAFGPATMGLTMGIGRMAGQMLAARVGEARLVAGSAVLAAIGALMVGLAPVQWGAVLGVGIIGAGIAVLVPSANSLLGRRVAPAQIGLAISRAWMIGFTGFFIGPVVMGLMAQAIGLRAAFAVVALVVATILLSLRRLTRQA